MLTVFDTSAIVAALTRNHPHFTWADAQVQATAQPALCAHSLAESYAVLTRHPQLRYPPARVREVLERLMQTWTVLPLERAWGESSVLRYEVTARNLLKAVRGDLVIA